jgi:(1->4)-alpha-D-glucan 1-alpha-D-glucosylmutase
MPAPGPHAEYLLYQTLLGTWPTASLDDAAFAKYRERIEEYMVKASREAKRRTSWANVNEEYENALRQFIQASLERREGNAFPNEIEELSRHLARFGYLNSLSQTLCKLTAPGVPDIYQGNEVWDDSLVDPDNRRPVDFALRQKLLDEVRQWKAPAMSERLANALANLDDGRCKLHVTLTALQLRRAHEQLFREGSYVPLKVLGEHGAHVLAYGRKNGDSVAIVAVPRLCLRLMSKQGAENRGGLPLGAQIWADTQIEIPRKLAGSTFNNVMTQRPVETGNDGDVVSISAGALFADFPVALLISDTRAPAT